MTAATASARVDLAFRGRAFASDDVLALFDWLPAGVSGSGAVDVRSDPGGILVVRARDLDLRFANGGTARGTFGMDIGPGEDWTVHAVDTETGDFDLANLEGVLDTVPLEGRLTGRTRADGPRDAVRARLDWLFHDRRADSAATMLRGEGVVAFGVPGDIVFRELRLDTARLALATVRADFSRGRAARRPRGARRAGRAVAGRHVPGHVPPPTGGSARLARRGMGAPDTRRDTVAASGDVTMDLMDGFAADRAEGRRELERQLGEWFAKHFRTFDAALYGKLGPLLG